jgi:hypothetical protein
MIKMGIKENGKQDLIFASQVRSNLLLSTDELIARYGDRLVAVPCGKCIGCRLDHAKEWAVRCVLESLDHVRNSFITLTYSDEHCPSRLKKKHLSDFIRKLRVAHPQIKIRFFGCGEYGTLNGRPHYHAIIFGYDFPDRKFLRMDESSAIYSSEELDKLWSKGMTSVGDVSLQSCGYVARYSMKKVNQGKTDEFLLMSRMPGIGYNWFMENKDRIYLSDHVYGAFGKSHKAKVPRYFDKLAEKQEFDMLSVKDERVRRASMYNLLNRYYRHVEFAEQLNMLTEDLLISRIKSLRRNL